MWGKVRFVRGGPGILFAVMLGGCGVTGFEASHQVSNDEGEALVRRAPFLEKTPHVLPEPPSSGEQGVVAITLAEALRLSIRNNLRYLLEGEQLDVQLLTLEVLRHGWEPALAPVVANFGYTTSPDAPRALGQDATMAVSQKTRTGGLLSASWTHSASQPPGRQRYAGFGTVAYTQPILRGAGSRPALEELLAAERQYAYARRFREYNRLSLLVLTVESYFELQERLQTLENFRRNLDRTQKQALAAEIQESFGRVTRTDVFRSRLQVTGAQRAVDEQREQLKIALDAFKIDLGLPPEIEITLTPEKIEYRSLDLAEGNAIAAALEYNPAFLTARDVVEDARRALALAENVSLPRLDMAVAYTWSTDEAPRLLGGYELGARDLTLSGALEIPLDGHRIRRNVQKAVISYRQAERELLRARDALTRDVRTQMTLVRQSEVTMGHHQRAIQQAERAARLAEFDYRRGKSHNRDVLEAQEQLLQARNAYERALVTTRVGQLRLLQFVGRLEVDAEGKWAR